MKITIEPTDNNSHRIELQSPKIALWVPGDDHTLEQVIEHLVTPALRAFGYGVSDGQIVVNMFDPEA